MSHAHPHKPTLDDRYEQTDAQAGKIVKFGIWLTLFTLASLGAMYGFLRALQKIDFNADVDASRHAMAPTREIPPEPRLESLRLNYKDNERQLMVDDPENPGRRIAPFTTSMWTDFRSQTNEHLATYGWIDTQAKIARIPIERAMEIQLKKGFATSKKTN